MSGGNPAQAPGSRRSTLQILARRSVVFPDLAASVGPLSPGQKFKLFVSNSISPHVLAGSAASAGLSQATDSNSGYGQGGEGYGKRFGASMARNATSNFFGTFLLPSLLRQDPRFFVKGNEGFRESAMYAVGRVVMTRTDDGREALNWSGLMGPLASESIANSYLPPEERTAGRTFRRYGMDLAFRAGGNVLREYWPTFFKRLRRSDRVAAAVGTAPAGGTVASTAAPSSASSLVTFGGTYDKLTEQQRALVNDWVKRYNQRTGRHLTPENAYDAASISPRATFEAVTNALATTRLTAENGESLGTALDLVEAIQTVRGKVPRAKSDLQFRVFVAMKPQAVQVLDASREFSRRGDNTVFHNGYPLNYRQQGGEPSIQVSMSRDGKRADIDVDYRSSGFPAALFNGHLTADNSDVRAGDNYSAHARRWQGLANWWRNLFGLPVEHESGFVPEPEHDLARRPRLTADAKLEDVVSDFLATWLLRKKPNEAVAYFSPSAFRCLTAKREEEKTGESDPPATGPVPHELWDDMEETTFLLGHPATLSDAVAPVGFADSALTVIPHKQASQFTLAKVPDDIAAEFGCADTASNAKRPRKYGTFYASALRIRVPGGDDAPFFLLWRKEQGFWKIVSIQTDPSEVSDGLVPDTSERTPRAKRATAKIHPHGEMLRRVQSFFDTLFVKKDPDAAFKFFAPSAYPCVNLALEAHEKPASDLTQAEAYLRRDLQEMEKRAPAAQNLVNITEGYDPGDPALQVIRHSNQQAYVLASVPKAELSGLTCESRSKVSSPGLSALPLTGDGPYFATFFQIIEPGNEAAPLGLLWAEQNGEWRIVAYRMDEP